MGTVDICSVNEIRGETMTDTPPVETLERFGGEFQSKTLSLLIRDHGFVQQTLDMLKPEFFESDARKWIVNTVVKYFEEYTKLPTGTVFMHELDKVESDVSKVAIKAELRTVQMHVSDEDLDYVKDKFLEFCKNQTLKSAIYQSVDLLERQDFDGIKVLVDNALRAGGKRDFGHDWKKDVDLRLSDDARLTMSTPWECLNKIMDGGLAAGELGVVAAPSGAGKSWILAAIGSQAMKEGKKVIHFTLELNDNYTGLRYDTIFCGIEPSELRNNKTRVKKMVAGVPGEIVIKYFPSKTVNAHKLLAHIHQLKASGYDPDLIIVDYGDLLRSNSKEDIRYLELGAIYEELRSIAGELQIPCWTASQTQRSSISEEVIQADKIAESYGKIMIADFVFSFSRTLNDKQTNTGRVHVIKNRFGPDGMTFPAKMNVLEGVIEMYNENSTEGIAARQAMKNSDTIAKKMLYTRFTEIHDPEGNDLG